SSCPNERSTAPCTRSPTRSGREEETEHSRRAPFPTSSLLSSRFPLLAPLACLPSPAPLFSRRDQQLCGTSRRKCLRRRSPVGRRGQGKNCRRADRVGRRRRSLLRRGQRRAQCADRGEEVRDAPPAGGRVPTGGDELHRKDRKSVE